MRWSVALLGLQALPLAAVFFVSGISKLSRLEETATTIRGYGLIEAKFAWAAAFLLGTVEVAIAVTVLASPPRLAASVAVAVLLGFTSVLVVLLARGVRLDCGCFGRSLPSVVSWWTVARNGFVAWPAVLLFRAPQPWHATVASSPVPSLIIASTETCALFLIAAGLGLNSIAALEDEAVSNA